MVYNGLSAEEVAVRLGGNKAYRSGDGFSTLCPAHDDHNNSLSIADGKNGGLVVHCHARCPQDSVIEALARLGIAVAPPHERRATKPKAATNGCISTLFKKGFDITDVYPYRDRNGELLYENVRLERSSNGQRIKTFRQRRPDGAGGWVESIEGIPRVPYRLPELLQTDGQNIHATEGEKDTNRLASIGLASTYIAAPTSKENAPDLNVFSGRFVYIHEDNDVAGRLRYEIALDGKTTELGEEELRALRLEADALGLRPRDTYFDDVCLDLARRNSHHPVREYLDSLQWDGIPCLDRWLSVYAGAEDTELICAFGRKHLVAAVRRVRQPGCKYDTCLAETSSQYAAAVSARIRGGHEPGLCGVRDITEVPGQRCQ